jgi:hypothetical protein
MVTTKAERETRQADRQRRVTPGSLLAIAMLGCLTAAVFGAAPLAAWVNTSILGGTAVEQAAAAWLGVTQRLGLDRPYAVLRRVVRDAEAARFGGEYN